MTGRTSHHPTNARTNNAVTDRDRMRPTVQRTKYPTIVLHKQEQWVSPTAQHRPYRASQKPMWNRQHFPNNGIGTLLSP